MKTNSEFRIPNVERSPKSKGRNPNPAPPGTERRVSVRPSAFGFHSSFVIRHSSLRRPSIFALLAVLLFAVSPAPAAAPASPLDGTWRWNFTNADGVIIQPTLKVKTEDDGNLSGLSRFRSGSSLPVTNFTFEGDQVGFEVARTRNGETTVTRYRGTFKGDKITGRMVASTAGEELSHDWSAFRFSDIEGVWKWRGGGFGGGGTNAPGGGRGGRRGGGAPGGGAPGAGRGGGEITLTIKREEGDHLSGKLSLGQPGQAEQEIHEARYHDGNVSFETERTRSDGELSTNYYWGKFSKDAITGKFTTDAGGVHRTNDWRAARAE